VELYKGASGMLESLVDITKEHAVTGSCRVGHTSVSQWGPKMFWFGK
jgi:hypothetical protein